MEGIEASLNHLANTCIPAKIDIYLNIKDPKTKGIHMSRLYLNVIHALKDRECNQENLEALLEGCLESHSEISDYVALRISWTLVVPRKALVSDFEGIRHYPIQVWAEKSKNESAKFETKLSVDYSSTCPCSAALSRQVLVQAFKEKFYPQANNDQLAPVEDIAEWLSEHSLATAHGQRSRAQVWVNQFLVQPQELIDQIENTLGTPVQGAVKRPDEQEFARRNAENLMFSEDAVRRINALISKEHTSRRIKVEHFESLHPHNAVAEIATGIFRC